MKKAVCILAVVTLVLSLAACGTSLEGKHTNHSPAVSEHTDTFAGGDDAVSSASPTPDGERTPVSTDVIADVTPEPVASAAGDAEATPAPVETVEPSAMPIPAESASSEVTATPGPEETASSPATVAPVVSASPTATAQPVESVKPAEPTHAHSYNKTVTSPTCTEEGYTTYICTCGESYVADMVKPAGHSYGAWVTLQEPTAATAGKAERKCATCSATEDRVLDKIIAGHTHNYTPKQTKAPFCTTEGVMTYICSCGSRYNESIAALGHDYQFSVVAATCTEQGYTITTCANGCGMRQVADYVDAMGHVWDTQSCTDAKVCTICGSEGQPKNHMWKVTSCETNMVCSVCNTEGEHFTHNWKLGGYCGWCNIFWCEYYGHLFGNYVYCRYTHCGVYDEEIVVQIQNILNRILTANMSEFEKVKAIHDYIAINTRYDWENYVNDTVPTVSCTARGVLKHGVAVCGGYAETFQLFCQFAGIECETVRGIGLGGPHAWNQVQIDGKWYNVDVTWDDTSAASDDEVVYTYFLRSDAEWGGHIAHDAHHTCDETYPRELIPGAW